MRRASNIGTIYPLSTLTWCAKLSSVLIEIRGLLSAKHNPLAEETPMRKPV